MLELSNLHVTMKLDEPGDLYKGTRFDHSAYLYSLVYKGVEFCSQEYRHEPTGCGGAGLCSEIGIFHPPGFAEANVGEWFLKPGVGLLKKKAEVYVFHEHYEPEECVMDTVHFEKQLHSIRLTTGNLQINGYQLFISRTFRLTGCGLIISYELENRGSKSIRTEEYIHNFIAIDHQQIGSGYALSWNDAEQCTQFPEFMRMEEGQLGFHREPQEAFYFRPQINPNGKFTAGISCHNKAGFQEIVDFKPSLFAVWGCPHALSVEIFKEIVLLPGEQLSYQREIVLSVHDY